MLSRLLLSLLLLLALLRLWLRLGGLRSFWSRGFLFSWLRGGDRGRLGGDFLFAGKADDLAQFEFVADKVGGPFALVISFLVSLG